MSDDDELARFDAAMEELAATRQRLMERRGATDTYAGSEFYAYLRPDPDGRWSGDVYSHGANKGRFFAADKDTLIAELIAAFEPLNPSEPDSVRS